MEPHRKIFRRDFLKKSAAWAMAGGIFVPKRMAAAVGSWNGISFTGLNGIAQTAWNGTGISCAAGGSSVAIDTIATAVSGIDSNIFQITTAVVGSGSNRLLVVYCTCGDSTAGDRVVLSVISDLNLTGWVHLTAADADNADYVRSEIWYKVAPATGTHTVTVTFTGSCRAGMVNAISYTGVDQTTPNTSSGAVNGTSAATAPTTGSQTVGTGELLTGLIATDASAISVTAGTQRWELENIDGDVSSGSADRNTTGAVTWSQASNPYAISWTVLNAA